MQLLRHVMDWVGRPPRRHLERLVADASREAVWRKVAHRVANMRTSVARGYIRARAISVVAKHCEALSWQYPHLRTVQAAVRAAALERVVRELELRAARLAPVAVVDTVRRAA